MHGSTIGFGATPGISRRETPRSQNAIVGSVSRGFENALPDWGSKTPELRRRRMKQATSTKQLTMNEQRYQKSWLARLLRLDYGVSPTSVHRAKGHVPRLPERVRIPGWPLWPRNRLLPARFLGRGCTRLGVLKIRLQGSLPRGSETPVSTFRWHWATFPSSFAPILMPGPCPLGRSWLSGWNGSTMPSSPIWHYRKLARTLSSVEQRPNASRKSRRRSHAVRGKTSTGGEKTAGRNG